MGFPKPEFSKTATDAAKAHAVSSYPLESCGMIVDGEYVPCENVSSDPSNAFKIAESVTSAAGDGLQAIIHSHPDGSRSPSAADMKSQMAFGCIFGIVPCNQLEAFGEISWWGDFTLDTPLIGREFVHGIYDCYSLVRAWFWQTKQIKLPDFPRDDKWWLDNQNLYLDNFLRLGFTIVDKKDVALGDCFIGKVRSDVPNHGGIVLERGMGLHHLSGKLSRREPIARWDKFVIHYLRYGAE